MEPAELSLKLVEITLQKKHAEILSDILKIGIPSLITLCSLLSAYLIAKKSNEKDITITKLKFDSDSNKEIMTREIELVKNVSVGLSEVHNTASQYTSLFAAKLDLLRSGLPFPKEREDNLSAAYDAYVKRLHDNIVIESNILLLGNQEIIDAFRAYHSLITSVCTNHAPHDVQIKYNDLLNEVNKLNAQKETVFRSLSARYLSGYS